MGTNISLIEEQRARHNNSVLHSDSPEVIEEALAPARSADKLGLFSVNKPMLAAVPEYEGEEETCTFSNMVIQSQRKPVVEVLDCVRAPQKSERTRKRGLISLVRASQKKILTSNDKSEKSCESPRKKRMIPLIRETRKLIA